MYRVVVKEKGKNPVVAGRVWINDDIIDEKPSADILKRLAAKGVEIINLEPKKKVKDDNNNK